MNLEATKKKLKEDLEDKIYDLAEKALTDFIEKGCARVMTASGFPARAAGPMQAFYTEYGKKVLELVRTQIQFNPQWHKLRDLRIQIAKAGDELNQIANSLSLDLGKPIGLEALFIALAYPETARAITRAHLRRNQNSLKPYVLWMVLSMGAKTLSI